MQGRKLVDVVLLEDTWDNLVIMIRKSVNWLVLSYALRENEHCVWLCTPDRCSYSETQDTFFVGGGPSSKKVARDNSMVIGYGKRQLNGDWLRRKTAQWWLAAARDSSKVIDERARDARTLGPKCLWIWARVWAGGKGTFLRERRNNSRSAGHS